MPDIAIRVENLSKLYPSGRAQQRHDSLRDAVGASFRRSNGGPADHADELWALKDISFAVQPSIGGRFCDLASW
jgi:ABC-type polysaccharide/polyol phosphate transport system ATPase subunit